MDIKELFKKIANHKYLKDYGPFEISYKKQVEFLNHINEPSNNVESSFCQYKCQCRLRSVYKRFLFNLLSIPLIFLYFIKPNSRLTQIKSVKDVVVVFLDGKPSNIIPNIEAFVDKEIIFSNGNNEYLDYDDRVFFCKLFIKYFKSPFFLLKCLVKLRIYSYEINNNGNVSNIVVCNEYSFTSSFLTEYCIMKKIKHINVMHGEKLFYIRDSFFRFSECYIWDNYYKDLFNALRANNTYIVSIPDSLAFKIKERPEIRYHFKYYLGGESPETLLNLYKILQVLSQRYNICIRPHPRYTDVKWLKKNFEGIEIESSSKSIELSVLETRNAISLYSTVLNQAFYNNVNIIIDDVTDYDKYIQLKDKRYIMLNKDHKLLSEILYNLHD